MSITRWNVERPNDYYLEKDPDGEFVKFEDVKDLLAPVTDCEVGVALEWLGLRLNESPIGSPGSPARAVQDREKEMFRQVFTLVRKLHADQAAEVAARERAEARFIAVTQAEHPGTTGKVPADVQAREEESNAPMSERTLRAMWFGACDSSRWYRAAYWAQKNLVERLEKQLATRGH